MHENITWVLLAGALVLLMQGGFALVTAGLCRAKNAGQVVTMNFMIYPLTVLGFWVCGFALMYGGLANDHASVAVAWLTSGAFHAFDSECGPGLFGCQGFFLNSLGYDPMILRLFFFESAVVAVAVAIPTGVMAERWRFRNFILYGLWAGALPIAIFGNWVWGGGWLARLGVTMGLGHGFVDFAGSSVIHMAGGVIGLVGAVVLRPRLGKYAHDGRPRPMAGHNLINVTLGTLILSFGWMGFNLGPALANVNERITVIAVNTLLASALGTLGAYFVVITKFRKPDPSMLCNGMLAGLVAISGPCAFVNPTGAALIGLIAGVLVVYSVLFFEGKMRIDDPVGAISVHGVCGAWGALSVGLFADGTYGSSWNGVHATSKNGSEIGVAGALGPLFGGSSSDWSQLGAQAVGVLAGAVFLGVFALLWFKISNLIVPLRSKHEEEIAGLDLPEMGAECYPDFRLTDKGSTRTD